MGGIIHDRYLPFSIDEVEAHLANAISRGNGPAAVRRGAGYFTESIERYREYLKVKQLADKDRRKRLKSARQFEKDERFWTACCLISLEKSNSATWIALLKKCFSDPPAFDISSSWEKLMPSAPRVRLEAPLPSPSGYLTWLATHFSERNLVPYVLEEAVQKRTRLEGFTHADAIVVCEETGFGIVVEAKATSDLSCEVSFDLMRNQIARIVDAMLEKPDPQQSLPLLRRDPDKTIFVLLTPRLFRDNWQSRLYGWLIKDYQNDPTSLRRDLPHRASSDSVDWSRLSRRLGWLTWEDCAEVLPTACPWLGGK